MKVRIQGKGGYKIVDLNRRKAIRERCLNCTGFSYAEANRCEHVDCPLHRFRSGKGKQDAKDRNQAIRKFCLWCMNDSINEVSKCTAPDCSLFAYRKSKLDRSIKIDSMQKINHIERSKQTILLEDISKHALSEKEPV